METMLDKINETPAKFANEHKPPVISVMGWHPSFVPDVIRLTDAFSKESLAEYGMEVEAERREIILKVCQDMVLFLLKDGKPVGVIGGFIVNGLTNSKLAVQEVIWYVDKEHRAHGKKLMVEFEKLARSKGASSIIMCLMCNSMQERLDKYYKRLGYKPFEVQYMKEL